MNNPTPEDVQAELDKLDGTLASTVAMLTGVTVEELEDFGGLPED